MEYKSRKNYLESICQGSPSDYSDIEKLGTTIQKSSTGVAVQERIVVKVEQDMRIGQLKARIDLIDKALACLDDDCKNLFHLKYNLGYSMGECMAETPGMSEREFYRCLRRLRETVAPFVLGVFGEPVDYAG